MKAFDISSVNFIFEDESVQPGSQRVLLDISKNLTEQNQKYTESLLPEDASEHKKLEANLLRIHDEEVQALTVNLMDKVSRCVRKMYWWYYVQIERSKAMERI